MRRLLVGLVIHPEERFGLDDMSEDRANVVCVSERKFN